MTPTPVPVPTRSLAGSLSETLTRPVTRRHLVVGGLLLSLATAAPLISHVGVGLTAPARPAAEARAVLPPALVAPSRLRAVPRELPDRASRGGARTALPASFALRTVPVGRSFTGLASWYGGSFQGRRTANGETFDTGALTAASRTLPFGTRLRVCRGSRCVVVRVNDRGPYVSGRVLDLSAAASASLGFSGVAEVTATPVGLRRVPVTPVRALAASAPRLAPVAASPRVDLRPTPRRAARRSAHTHGREAGTAPLGLALVGASGLGVGWARRRRS